MGGCCVEAMGGVSLCLSYVESAQVPQPLAQMPFLIFCFQFCKQATD